MSLAKLKEIAKKLFARVHNFSGIVTVNIIKKQYPKFRASIAEHWEFLVLKLLGRDRRANRVKKEVPAPTPFQQLEEVVSKLNKIGIYSGKYDFLLGVSCTFFKEGLLRGSIGYSESKKSFYYTVGRLGVNRYVADIDKAVSGLFPNIKTD